MDLMLRGRGADIGVRAPAWVIRVCGACVAVGTMALADLLGISYVTGFGPSNLRIAAAIIGALLAPTALGVVLWIAAILLTCVVMLVSVTPVAGVPAHNFIRADADAGPVDAVIVFSGSVSNDGRLTGQVVDRLLTGLREVQARHVPTLALSVVSNLVDDKVVTTEKDQRALVELLGGGVDVRFVYDVNSTRDEALAFAAMARTHGWKRVLAVTSPLHTKRACRALEVAGLAVQCRPAESRAYSLAHLQGSVNRLLVFQDVVYETAATILYRIREWN